jgi:hypothetical protein
VHAYMSDFNSFPGVRGAECLWKSVGQSETCVQLFKK